MNQLEICQAMYRSNTWMGRTRTDGPDEFEPSKFDCITIDKYLRSRLTLDRSMLIFDFSAKVAHKGLPSIYTSL